MNATRHPYQEWDAAYVLGALSPAERREYEEHLAGCPMCQTAVAELAGMPGLLAQIGPEDAEVLVAASSELVADRPPDSLVPKVILLAGRRRRRMVTAIIGAAAALVVILGGIGIATGLLNLQPDRARHLALRQVVPSGITANVDVVPISDGTEINVECQYGDVNDPRPGHSYEEYSIYVVDRSGHAEFVKKWPAKPNKVMRPSGTTSLRMSQIAEVQIRQTNTDETLLQGALE